MTPLDYAKDPVLKTRYPSPPGPSASLGLAHLSSGILSCMQLSRSVVSDPF